MLHYQPKKSKKSGFSLIEFLVVVAIIGVLAAVAIPAYQRYQVSAAQNSLTASMQNIGKGFLACITTSNFSDCDTLGEIRVNCDECNEPQSIASPLWCVDSDTESSGNTYKACVGINASTGIISITNSWDESDCSALANATGACGSTPTGCTSTPETSSGAGDGTCTGTYIGATGTCQASGTCS